jgi:hypothetical protein
VKCTRKARSIADQTTGLGELAPAINRRKAITRRQRHELLAPTIEERVGNDDKRLDVQLIKSREGSVDLAFGTRLQDRQLYFLRARGRPAGLHDTLAIRMVRIYQGAQQIDLGEKVTRNRRLL